MEKATKGSLKKWGTTILGVPVTGGLSVLASKILDRWGILDTPAIAIGDFLKANVSGADIATIGGFLLFAVLYAVLLRLTWGRTVSAALLPADPSWQDDVARLPPQAAVRGNLAAPGATGGSFSDQIYVIRQRLESIPNLMEKIEKLAKWEPRRHQHVGTPDENLISDRDQEGYSRLYEDVYHGIKDNFPYDFEYVVNHQAAIDREIKGDVKYLQLEIDDEGVYKNGEQKREYILAHHKLAPLKEHLNRSAVAGRKDIANLEERLKRSLTSKDNAHG